MFLVVNQPVYVRELPGSVRNVLLGTKFRQNKIHSIGFRNELGFCSEEASFWWNFFQDFVLMRFCFVVTTPFNHTFATLPDV